MFEHRLYHKRKLATLHVSWTLPHKVIDWLIDFSFTFEAWLLGFLLHIRTKINLNIVWPVLLNFKKLSRVLTPPLPEISSSKRFWCSSYTQWSFKEVHLVYFVVTVRPRKENLAGGQWFSWEKGFKVSLHMKTATKCMELDPIETQRSNVLAGGLRISLFTPKNRLFDHLCSQVIEAGATTSQ